MKKALVLGLLVFALGLAASAEGFTGSWATDITLDIAAGSELTVTDLTSLLEADYAVGGWVFGFNTFVGASGLFDLNFDVAGILGAFTFASFVDFDTVTPAFEDWETVAQVSIAGVDIYTAFAVQEAAAGVYGAGWAVGGHGAAGSVEVWAQANFNLSGGITHYFPYWPDIETFYGWDYMTDWGTYWSCAGQAWYSGDWSVIQTNSCTPTWSKVYIAVKAPLGCLNLGVSTSFSCTSGWDGVTFGLNNLNLGAGWFQLDDLDITFTPVSKTVSTDFTLTFGSAVCVTPYFDLNQEGLNVIQGITLRALLLTYEYNGVTLKAGELFAYYAGFTKAGALSTYANCVVPNADEFIGIWYDSDSCCGGSLSASFVTFFDAGSQANGIFDYVLMVAGVELGIGSNVSIRTGLEVSPTGIDALSLGFTLSW